MGAHDFRSSFDFKPAIALVLGLVIGLWAGPNVFADEGNDLYVQTATAQLKASPKGDAAVTATVKRGDKLTSQAKDGVWFQVTGPNGAKGWISKIVVANHAPVGNGDVDKALAADQNLGKAAHKRAGSVSVSASSRGLVSGNRTREGREKYESDDEAVQKLDGQKVDEKELQKFKQDGKMAE